MKTEQTEKTEVDYEDLPTLDNKKHMAFCLEYLTSFNALKSYMKVYGCGKPSAYVGINRVMKRPEVQDYLNKMIMLECGIVGKINDTRADMILKDKGKPIVKLSEIAYGPPGNKYSNVQLDAIKLILELGGRFEDTGEIKRGVEDGEESKEVD